MLYHVVSLVSTAAGFYGAALSVVQRRDLAAEYTRLIGEIGLYAEDGINLMIKNGWLEQPPMAEDRKIWLKKGNDISKRQLQFYKQVHESLLLKETNRVFGLLSKKSNE